MNDYVKNLVRLAKRCRTAEARIARAYFSKKRPRASHIRWLRAQGFKEYSAIKPILSALANLYSDIGNGVDRREFEELTEKLADETKHARLILDLVEEISGKKTSSKDLLWLPEDRRLAKVRGRYSKTAAGLLHGSQPVSASEIKRRDENLERAAITLTEGGGGAIYEVCSRLKMRGIEGKIARAFREIYRDEVKHKDVGVRSLARLIKTKKDYERAARIVREVSSQRLRMRNEQFGFPLDEKTVAVLETSLKLAAPAPRGSSTRQSISCPR